jgi:hypothetical protein
MGPRSCRLRLGAHAWVHTLTCDSAALRCLRAVPEPPAEPEDGAAPEDAASAAEAAVAHRAAAVAAAEAEAANAEGSLAAEDKALTAIKEVQGGGCWC